MKKRGREHDAHSEESDAKRAKTSHAAHDHKSVECSIPVRGWGAVSATDPMKPLQFKRREPGPTDVLIDIKYAGICHSDIHTVRGEWGQIKYPQVVGHEIAGVVHKVGDKVTKHKVGDLVGVGCMVDSCRSCSSCKEGLEQYCSNGCSFTYNSKDQQGHGAFPGEKESRTHGGYSTAITVDQDFVLKLDKKVDMARVAPLLCAGITLYSPLLHWGPPKGKQVAIVGMGGLGHMGVKLGAALGGEITVLSQSLSKKDDAIKFGAKHVYATSDEETFKKLAGHFDYMVNTVSASGMDFSKYLGLLKRDGSMICVGAPEKPSPLAVMPLIFGRRSLAGSAIGGIPETQEMLDFCIEHNIYPEVELIAPDQINKAYERVVKSDVRYRFVIDASKF